MYTPHRRRWSFSLRTLFVVVTLIAVSAFGVREYYEWQQAFEYVPIGLISYADLDVACSQLNANMVQYSAQMHGSQRPLLYCQAKDADRVVKILTDEEVRFRPWAAVSAD